MLDFKSIPKSAKLLFMAGLLLAAAGFFRYAPLSGDNLPGHSAEAADPRFTGLRHATPAEVRAALPEINTRPILLEFTSRFCHDCQQIAPVVARLSLKYPTVSVRRLDILEDRDKAPVLFRTFKPVSVPVLVFIDRHGVIRDVLYNAQPPQKIAASLQALQERSSSTARKPQG